MTGRSLHIGLNHVDPNAYDGWDGELAGCINDARDFHRLASGLGYQASILTDSQATSHRVLQELSAAASECRSGDILLVTYSGHGGQVSDATGEEEDGKDETWVLFDREIVDDELYAVWSQFSEGVRILVISDSCHSGTVAKVSMYEKMDAAMGRRAQAVPTNGSVRSMPHDVSARVAERDRAMYDTVQFLAGRDVSSRVRASVILLSGCQDSQLSYDGDNNGLFTGTFLQVWNQGAFRGSYRGLHRAILAEMPPHQTPNFYTVGAHDPAFEEQRPFSISVSTASPSPTVSTGGGASQPERPTLRMGDSGEAVRELQGLLNGHGHALTADGFFGRLTDSAVRQFQTENGLAANGVVAEQTWRALDGSSGATPEEPGSQPVSPTPAGGTPTTRPTLRRGDSGPAVLEMQEMLRDQGYYLPADGVFGPRTESLVKSFQRANGIVADGVVGPQTWRLLEQTRSQRPAAPAPGTNEVGMKNGGIRGRLSGLAPAARPRA